MRMLGASVSGSIEARCEMCLRSSASPLQHTPHDHDRTRLLASPQLQLLQAAAAPALELTRSLCALVVVVIRSGPVRCCLLCVPARPRVCAVRRGRDGGPLYGDGAAAHTAVSGQRQKYRKYLGELSLGPV